MFALAQTRADASGAPDEENRAALLALACYLNDWPLHALVAEAHALLDKLGVARAQLVETAYVDLLRAR